MDMFADIEVSVENAAIRINADKGDGYYKNIVYRDPKTHLFPQLGYYFNYEVGYGDHHLYISIIGFEKSMSLQDEPFLPCIFHDAEYYYPDIYEDGYWIGKGIINLNANKVLDRCRKPYLSGKYVDVLKIIIALDSYHNKPTVDCRLTKKEELYFRNLYDPRVLSYNPHDEECSSWSRDYDYWNIFPKRVAVDHYDGIREDFERNGNFKAAIDLSIGESSFTTIDIDDGYYEDVLYREAGRFPNLRYKIKRSNRRRQDDMQLSLIGFQKSGGECMIHRVLKLDNFTGRIDLNEEIKPYISDVDEKLKDENYERNFRPYMVRLVEVPSDLNVMKIFISAGDYLIRPSIDCILTEAPRKKIHTSKNATRENKMDVLAWEHNGKYWIREAYFTEYMSLFNAKNPCCKCKSSYETFCFFN